MVGVEGFLPHQSPRAGAQAWHQGLGRTAQSPADAGRVSARVRRECECRPTVFDRRDHDRVPRSPRSAQAEMWKVQACWRRVPGSSHVTRPRPAPGPRAARAPRPPAQVMPYFWRGERCTVPHAVLYMGCWEGALARAMHAQLRRHGHTSGGRLANHARSGGRARARGRLRAVPRVPRRQHCARLQEDLLAAAQPLPAAPVDARARRPRRVVG
jgi:hypothetical protein